MRAGSGARTAVLTFGFVVIGAVMAFGVTLSVTHGSGAVDAGRLFQLTAVLAIATTACTAGADVGLVRTLPALAAQYRRSEMIRAVRTAVPPPLVLSTGVALAALLVAVLGPVDRDLATAVIVLAVALVAGTVMNLCFGTLRGLHRVPWFSFLQNVALPSLRWVGVLVALWAGTSLPALTLAWCVPVLVVLGLALAVARRAWAARTEGPAASSAATVPAPPPTPSPAATHPVTEGSRQQRPPAGEGFSPRVFWGFSSARGVTAMVEALLEWIDVLLVATFLGPAAAGVYGVVNRCVRAGTMLDHTARMVTGPGISAAMAVKDVATTRRIYTLATAVLVTTAWPLYLTLVFHGDTVLGFFGPGFDTGHLPMTVVSLAMLLVVAAGGVQSVLLMAGRSVWQLGNKTVALAVALALNVTLIPLWGITGAAVAWSAALLTDVGLALWQITTRLGVRARWSVVLRSGLAAGGWTVVAGTATTVVLGPGLPGLLLHLALVGPVVAVMLTRLTRIPVSAGQEHTMS